MSAGHLNDNKYNDMVNNAQTGNFISSQKFKDFIGDVREKINDNWDAFDAHKSSATLDHPDGSVIASKLADGAVTDAKIGTRTIDDTSAPNSDSGQITALFSRLAYMIKAITGKPSWRTAPSKTLEDLNAHIGSGGSAHQNATASAAGFMSASDKSKLDGIQSGAQVNQNAFSRVNDVQATAEEDALSIEGGTGITVTTSPALKKVVITATGDQTPGPHATSHISGGADAIPDAVPGGNSGLMSGADKAKLDSATSTATPNTIVQRDSAGRAQVAAPSAANDAANKSYVDNAVANRARTDVRPTFTAGIQDGDANNDVSIIKSVQHHAHTRTVELTYSGGNLSTVREKDGANTIKTTTLNYSGGRLVSVVEVAGGVTVTQTLNYDGSGNLTSVSRAVS